MRDPLVYGPASQPRPISAIYLDNSGVNLARGLVNPVSARLTPLRDSTAAAPPGVTSRNILRLAVRRFRAGIAGAA
jgi:hypothetical protein